MTLTHRHKELAPELLQELLRQHETLFNAGTILTQNKKKQSVREIKLNGNDYIVKQYTSSFPLGTLRLLLRGSRADRSFNYAQTLTAHNIPTPKHIAIFKHIGLFKNSTYLIMEKSEGTAFFEYIQPDYTAALPDEALKNIGRIVCDFQKLNLSHGDLHTRNLIIHEDDSVEIIDLDGSSFSKKGAKKDLRRLKQALASHPNYWQAISENLPITPDPS